MNWLSWLSWLKSTLTNIWQILYERILQSSNLLELIKQEITIDLGNVLLFFSLSNLNITDVDIRTFHMGRQLTFAKSVQKQI